MGLNLVLGYSTDRQTDRQTGNTYIVEFHSIISVLSVLEHIHHVLTKYIRMHVSLRVRKFCDQQQEDEVGSNVLDHNTCQYVS